MTEIGKIILVLAGVSCSAAQTPYDSLYVKSSLYKNRTAMFASSETTSAQIVFFGNSITSAGDWNTLLDRDSISNQGIGGDNTLGMLHRLQYVYRLRPKLCFIMAGINDLYEDVPVKKIFENYRQIIDTLRAKNITLIIQSTLYVNPQWKRAEAKNIEVKKLNLFLQQYCSANNITFIELNAKLSTNGMLSDQYTTDGVHLTPTAYAEWTKVIVPILLRYGL
jgi:lysophospholipase L1-like esterase